jgi:hypothetical protein
MPIDNATLWISSYIQTGGELTLSSPAIQSTNGQFAVPVIYPRAGQWTIDVTVDLPGAQESIRESYLVYVYGVSSHIGDGVSPYRSLSQIETTLAAKPAKEYWIIIPQGTQEIATHSFMDDELFPSEIHLQVSGQNTLIIQNDDVVDHTVGPFFIRAGESIRQEFMQPAVYQGACSIRHNDEISIIVEG